MNTSNPLPFAALVQSSLDSTLAISRLWLAGAERLAPLNLNAARGSVDDVLSSARAMIAVKTPQELFALQAKLTQPAIGKLLACSQQSYQILTETQAGISQLIEAQFADLNRTLATAFDAALKNAPAGSEAAIAALKSGMVSASSSYERASSAARQFTQTASANVASATEAAVKAAGIGALQLKSVA